MPGFNVCVDCHELTEGTRCPAHERAKRQVETQFQKGKYGRPWRRAVEAWIKEDPDNRVFCVKCREDGKLVAAEETDHIIPHRGDDALFWDRKNWQRLCRPCHSRKTAAETMHGSGRDE